MYVSISLFNMSHWNENEKFNCLFLFCFFVFYLSSQQEYSLSGDVGQTELLATRRSWRNRLPAVPRPWVFQFWRWDVARIKVRGKRAGNTMIRSVMMRSCDHKTLKSQTEGMNSSREIMYTNIHLSEALGVRSHSCLLTSNSRVWTSLCALDVFYTQGSLPSRDTSTEDKALLILLRGWNTQACTNTALSCCLAGMVHRNCTADGWTHPLVPHEDACYTFNDTLLFIGEVSSGTKHWRRLVGEIFLCQMPPVASHIRST